MKVKNISLKEKNSVLFISIQKYKKLAGFQQVLYLYHASFSFPKGKDINFATAL